MCATESMFRSNRSQIVRILLPCGVKPFFCEGALKRRNIRDLCLNNLKVIGTKNHVQLHTSAEDETEQKRRQEDKKTRHKDQNRANVQSIKTSVS